MQIRFFTTGGTFDKAYNELDGKLFFETTHVPEMLLLGRSKLEINISTLMMVDSLEMSIQEKEQIAFECEKCTENRIIITHGTDTMVETAAIIAHKKLDKTIVLTGAMIPYKFGSSDGFFNLGAALAFVQTLPTGVYIAMNGRFFNWNNCRKNKTLGLFETLL